MPYSSVALINSEMLAIANPAKARLLSGFFKTGKGEYGEGDFFLGITVPQTRAVAKKHKGITLSETGALLKSRFHEVRLLSLLILVEKFRTGTEAEREKIHSFYLKHARFINNWDLVDLSAPKIIGNYLLGRKNRKILYSLASSPNLWERRISIISTLAFIRNGDFADALSISEMLLKDKHDLIHKALGWMLREVWKRDSAAAESFLKKHAGKLPRTTLRYAIEKMGEKRRKSYLEK